jgi:dolichol kinase
VRFGARFDHWFGALLRPGERHALTGATWLCLSCFVMVVLAPAPVAIAAMWCATIGDPAAAIVGRALSREGGRKTWAGSIACLVGSALGVWWLTPLGPIAACAVGLAAALAERPAAPLDDNVRVTLVTGAVTLLLS